MKLSTTQPASAAEQPSAADTSVMLGACDTPVGRLLIGCSDIGLLAISYADAAGKAEALLKRRVARHIPDARFVGGATSEVKAVAEQLAGYFAGKRTAWDIALDWRLTTGFRRAVQQASCQIGYGETLSYGQLAAAAGNPSAARAAGSAMATNPISIVVPCHRVVRSGGDIGNYGGGTDAKKFLLALEQSGMKKMPIAAAA